MTPFPETATANFEIIDYKIIGFLNGSIDPYSKLDSVFPKTTHSKDKLFDIFKRQKIEDFEIIETYTSNHGKTQHQIFALDKDQGIYATQSRSGTNGNGFEKKLWGATRLCRLGEKANHDYLTSLAQNPKK